MELHVIVGMTQKAWKQIVCQVMEITDKANDKAAAKHCLRMWRQAIINVSRKKLFNSAQQRRIVASLQGHRGLLDCMVLG